MTSRRFISHQQPVAGLVSIEGDEFYHLKTVTRLKVNDKLEVIDGQGSLYTCQIAELTRQSASARIVKSLYVEKEQPRLALAVSILKGRAMALMLEKLSEIGVDIIIPVQFDRSDTVTGRDPISRWRKIALQSLKVNHRLWPSDIQPVVGFDEFLTRSRVFPTRIMLDLTVAKNALNSVKYPVLSVVGPPGDFSDNERTVLREMDFISLRINEAVLRSETAAISIAAIITFNFNN